MTSTAIQVLGMHRSGTSAATGMLQILGVELGEQLMPAQKGVNERGFFEHEQLVELHDDILDALGSTWDDVLPLPGDWRASDAIRPFRQKLRDILLRDFAAAHLWAAKDPRICLLAPLWQEVFETLDAHPVYLHVIRDPSEVAASLARRDGFMSEKAFHLWSRYTLAAEQASRGGVRYFIGYDAVLRDPVSVASDIGTALKVSWPRSPANVAAELRAFLTAELRHHAGGEATSGGPAQALAREIYEAVVQAGPDGPEVPVWDAFAARFQDRIASMDAALVDHARWQSRQRAEFRHYNRRMRRSLSWRLLAPLRWAQKLFGQDVA